MAGLLVLIACSTHVTRADDTEPRAGRVMPRALTFLRLLYTKSMKKKVRPLVARVFSIETID